MPKYKYTAINTRGEVTKGIVNVSKYEDAVSIILKQNLYPLQIHIQKMELLLDKLHYNSIKTKDLAIFCRQFSTALIAGIPVLESLEIIKTQTENKNLKEIISDLYSLIQKGYTLSESMNFHSNVFSNLLISMVETGEISGNLDTVMNRMAEHYEREYKINQKLMVSITYPAIVSLVSLALVVILLVFILPVFVNIYNDFGTVLPLSTRVLLYISSAITKYWHILLLISSVIALGIKNYLHSAKGRYKWDKLKLQIPIVGKLYNKVVVSRFCRTMSTLIDSNVDLLKAIAVVSKVMGNTYISYKMEVVKNDIKKGMGLALPMKNSELFPPLSYHMVKLGEDTGKLDLTLEKAADYFDEEVKTVVEQLTAVIEPIIIIILGVVVAFILTSIVIPIFDIYSMI